MSNLSVSPTANPATIGPPPSNQPDDTSEQQLIEDIMQLLQQLLSSMNGQDPSQGGAMGGGGGGGGGGGSDMGGMPQMNNLMATGSGGPPLVSGDPGSAAPASGGGSPAATGAAQGPGNAQGSGSAQAAAPAANPGSSSGPEGLGTAPQTQALSQSQGQQVAGQYVTNLMHDFNLTKPQAQGVVANLWHESGGMNSGINQGGAIGQPSGNMADDNANGYGIAQWGGTRKEGLIAYAQKNGLDPSSQAANYGYLKQELETSQSGAISAVKNTSSAQDATAAFCNAFEQPSDPEMASRLNDLSLVQSA